MTSSLPPRIWVASRSEAAEVARLLGEFRDWFGNSDPSDRALLASVGRIAGTVAGEFLLVEHGERAAGVAQVRYRQSVWTSTEDCWLEDLWVSEDARGQGLGAALMDAVLDRARERGCARLELDVQDENEAALALYRAAGFEGKSVRPGGRAVFLQRRL